PHSTRGGGGRTEREPKNEGRQRISKTTHRILPTSIPAALPLIALWLFVVGWAETECCALSRRAHDYSRARRRRWRRVQPGRTRYCRCGRGWRGRLGRRHRRSRPHPPRPRRPAHAPSPRSFPAAATRRFSAAHLRRAAALPRSDASLGLSRSRTHERLDSRQVNPVEVRVIC
ncbi:hypothetical protein DFH09DRAFT_1371382, partial [Mycena vulgaris]